MLGVNFGSFSSSMSIGHKSQSALVFKTELLLSDTSGRSCPSLISFTDTHRIIGDQSSLVIKKHLKSSFQYINRFIGFKPDVPFYTQEMQQARGRNFYFRKKLSFHICIYYIILI